MPKEVLSRTLDWMCDMSMKTPSTADECFSKGNITLYECRKHVVVNTILIAACFLNHHLIHPYCCFVPTAMLCPMFRVRLTRCGRHRLRHTLRSTNIVANICGCYLQCLQFHHIELAMFLHTSCAAAAIIIMSWLVFSWMLSGVWLF